MQLKYTNKYVKIGIFLSIVLSVISPKAHSQEYPFAQYHLTPLMTNPATLGQSNQMQGLLHYRYQPTGSGEAIQSSLIDFSYPILLKNAKHRIGLGASLGQDKVTDFFQSTGGNIGAAYHFRIKGNEGANKTYLQVGFQTGFYQKSLNPNGLSTTSQYVNGVFDASQSNGENYTRQNFMIWNAGAGAQLSQENSFGEVVNYVGFSTQNINRPNVALSGIEAKFPTFWQLTAGVKIYENESFRLSGTTRYQHQATNNLVNIGVLGKMRLDKNDPLNHSLQAGLWYNTNKAISVGLEYQKGVFFVAGATDIAISESTTVWQNNATGQLHIGIRKNIKRKEKPKDEIKEEPKEEKKEEPKEEEKKEEPKVEEKKEEPKVEEKKEEKDPPLTKKEEEILEKASHVLFETSKSIIRPESFSILNELVELLNKYPNSVIHLVGHTDSDGADDKNLKLSQERSASVKAYLAQKGINADRITTDGKGESEPVTANDTPQNKAKNRRVDMKLTGKK